MGGGGTPPVRCHGNHLLLIWKIITKDARDNFDNTSKKSFSYLEEWKHKRSNPSLLETFIKIKDTQI